MSAKPIRKPDQTVLFQSRSLSVVQVAERLRTSRNTVVRLLESGELRGYRMTANGWWRIVEQSVTEYEKKLRCEYVPEDERQ
ncbi:MAG TPA: helix-turn-helix domain-containing protein [Terriglobales bacterium]|nr:helix-turn-helix domain-containing protein [Terriglobales bacterium]